jgi:hypothetical protein
LINLHAANGIVLYSPVLAKQIPRSHAANAFNIFRDSLFKFEVIRLCVFWDECREDDLDMESIPAVIQLIDEPLVLSELVAETYRANAAIGVRNLNPSEDPDVAAIEREMIDRHQSEFAKRQGWQCNRLDEKNTDVSAAPERS